MVSYVQADHKGSSTLRVDPLLPYGQGAHKAPGLPVYYLFSLLFSYLDYVRLTFYHILRYVRVDFLTTRILVYRSFGPEVLQLKDAF